MTTTDEYGIIHNSGRVVSKLMQKPQVDKKTARLVKDMLWKGRKQSHIQIVTRVSQATISRIKTGDAHADVPWPNGEVGGIPSSLSDPIKEVDWSADAKRYLTFPEEMQARILQVVNKRRIELDLHEIPDIAPAYATYLEADGEDEVWEAVALDDARKSEDTRLSILMTEFDELVEDEKAARRDEDTKNIFSQTKRERSPEDDAIRPQSPTLQYETMSISDILSIDPRNSIVREVVAMEDPFLLESVGILFKENRMQVDGWKGASIREQVFKLAEKLKTYPDISARLTKEEDE